MNDCTRRPPQYELLAAIIEACYEVYPNVVDSVIADCKQRLDHERITTTSTLRKAANDAGLKSAEGPHVFANLFRAAMTDIVRREGLSRACR